MSAWRYSGAFLAQPPHDRGRFVCAGCAARDPEAATELFAPRDKEPSCAWPSFTACSAEVRGAVHGPAVSGSDERRIGRTGGDNAALGLAGSSGRDAERGF